MKTLDEVIGMAERCTLPYPGDCLNCEYFEDDSGNDCRCKILADALHYLKHLQEYYQMSREHHEPNPALTWDELKQMEGKPVWVEGTILLSHWLIIDTIDEYMMVCSDRHRVGVPLFADVLGKCWQAYRKERE